VVFDNDRLQKLNRDAITRHGLGGSYSGDPHENRMLGTSVEAVETLWTALWMTDRGTTRAPPERGPRELWSLVD
jgi:hypothetical protein